MKVCQAQSAKHKKDRDRYKDMFEKLKEEVNGTLQMERSLRSTFPTSVAEGE